MSKIIGRLSSIGIGKESSRGTSVAPTYWIPFLEASAEDTVKRVVNETSIARLEDSDGSEITQKLGEFSWTTKLKQTHFGLVLLSLFGSVSSAVKGGETIVYEHTYSVGQTVQHQSLTVALKNANADVRFANAVIGKLGLSIVAGDYVKYSVEGLSKASASSSNTVAHIAETDFIPQFLTFKEASAQSGLTAASATVIRACTLEIDSHIMTEDVLGSVAPADIVNQAFSISGSITLVHNALTFQTYELANTYRAMRFDLVSDTAIGSSSFNALRIDLHRCSISNYKRNYTLNDLVEESFDFQAHYSLTDSKMVTAILTNLTASY